MGDRLFDIGAGVLIVTMIYVAVRPRSKLGDLIGAVGDMLAAVVRAATNSAREGV